MLFFEENNQEDDESAMFIKGLKENENPKENEISVDLEKNNEFIVKYREDRKEEEISKKLEESLSHKSLSLSERLKNTGIYQQTLISRCIQVKK